MSRPKKDKYEKALLVAVEALALYAEPESYHAISLLVDRPCGWFAEDRSLIRGHPFYKRSMHGAAARRALRSVAKIIK